MEYASPAGALAQGLVTGLSLAQNQQKMRQEQEQEKWVRKLHTAELGMKIVENKYYPASRRAEAFNKGVRPMLADLGQDWPEMTPETVTKSSFQDKVKANLGITAGMRKGTTDKQTGVQMIMENWGDALSTLTTETETEKAMRESITSDANRLLDEENKRSGNNAAKIPTESEAIEKQQQLNMQLANLNKADMQERIVSQYMGVPAGKVTQEMVDTVTKGVQRLKSYYNQFITNDDYRDKTNITMAEAKKMKDAKIPLDRLSRDFRITDAPDGVDPLKLWAQRSKAPIAAAPVAAGVMPPMSVGPAPVAAPSPAPVGGPVAAPGPMPTPSPMAAPAVPSQTAAPLSLSGGAVQPTPKAPLVIGNQSLQ